VRVAERVRVREIEDDEGRRRLRIIRRGTGSVVTWRRAQMVLLSAQGMPVAKIAEVTFTSDDRVRDVIHNFNADGSLPEIQPGVLMDGDDIGRWLERQKQPGTWAQLSAEQQERLTVLGVKPLEAPSPATAAGRAARG
jgi:hypothetical protein